MNNIEAHNRLSMLCSDGALIGAARALVLACGCSCALPQSVVAQEVEAQRPGPTEEIVVRAPRSLRSMRAAIEEAEDLAFSTFNELNTDDDYDIVCHRERPTGSQISYRNCRARFVDRLLWESTQVFFSLETSQPLPLLEIRHHMEILAEKIDTLARQNPDFLDATIEVQRRKDEYAAEINSRREE